MYRKNNKENENNFNKREGTKTRSDNRRDRNFNSKERSFDKKDRDFGKKYRNNEKSERSFDRKDRDFGKKYRNNEKSERSFDRKDRDFGKKYRNNEKSERSFDKKDRDFGKKYRNNEKSERSFDKKDRDFDRPERRRYKSNNEEYHNHNSRFRSFEKTKRRGITTQKQQSESVRLNKFIANSGVCSRREADELIAAGFVSVNDKVIKEMGFKVSSKDTIKLKGKKLTGEKKVYILLNKPKDFITTTDDERGRKTVMDLVKNACRERIYPVGRLDRNTTGVLLLTNDGDLTKMLTHPSYGAKKIYHVELNKRLKQSDIQLLLEGVELEDGIENVDDIQFVEGFPGRKVIGVEIHSGKNRIVRRLFEQLEYEVEKLDRVSFAGLTKRDLPRGHWRMLKDSEVSFLKMHHIPKN